MSTGPASRSDNLPRFGRGAALGLFLAFLLLGVAFTAPLGLHLHDSLPYTAVPMPGRELVHGAPGDYLQFYYYLWLVRERVLAGASFLRDPYQFAIDGPRSNLPNIFLPAALLFVPLSALGPRFAYNALVLLSFPFAGLAAALLARRYGVSRTGAAVAGTVFACMPYRVGALLGGHPAGLAYPLVPVVLWGLEGALAGSVWGGLAAGGALLGLAMMEPHFAYFSALGLPLYALVRVGLPAWRRELLAIGPAGWLLAVAVALAPAYGALAALSRQDWQAPLSVRLAVGTVIGLIALGVWQTLATWLLAASVVADPRAAARRSLLACAPWILTAAAATGRSGRLVAVALALPLVLHGLWVVARWRQWWHRRLPVLPVALAVAGALAGAGFLLLLQRLLLRRSVSGAGRSLFEVLLFSPTLDDLFTRVNQASGRVVYPGVVAVGLAVVAVVALAWRPPRGVRRVLWVFGPLVAVGVIVSLGPRLEAFPLFEVAFRLVPSWNFIRQPAKAQILVAVGLAVLAGVGTDALARPGGRRLRAALAVGLGLLIAVEYHPWRPTGVSSLPSGGAAFDTSRAEGPRALWIPFWPGDSAYSGLYLYATTLTRVPMLNGYSAWLDRSYLPDVYHPLEAVNLGVVGEAEARVLRRYGVRQVILDQDAFPLKVSAFGPALTLAHLRASPYLDPVETPAGDWALRLFRVRETPRPDPRRPAPDEPARRALGGGVPRAGDRTHRRRSRCVERPRQPCAERRGSAGLRDVRPLPAAPAGDLPRPVPAEGGGQHGGASCHDAGRARHPGPGPGPPRRRRVLRDDGAVPARRARSARIPCGMGRSGLGGRGHGDRGVRRRAGPGVATRSGGPGARASPPSPTPTPREGRPATRYPGTPPATPSGAGRSADTRPAGIASGSG